ncbi:MAG: type VI secretion system baseplate subunit TssG [Gammaproteobacteria bacterium]|nr:type VI secretion system baseplate subunit TssG [Gammaproteobacteria bacterium]
MRLKRSKNLSQTGVPSPRTPKPDRLLELLTALQEKPYRFGFFQALRRLECAYPDKPRFGESQRPNADPIRLGQEPSVTFAPSTLASLTPGEKPRLEVLFFGLFGPNGPLPLHLTEYARDRMRNSDDKTFAHFADMFHHRLLSLFYRAWANTQPAVNFDRPEQDRFAIYLGSLFGLGLPALRHRDAMPDQNKLHFAGRLVCQNRNAESLLAILGDFFKMPVSLQEFVGQWIPLPEDCRCRLGASANSSTLGENATIGANVWDRRHKFRIIFGPVDLPDYRRLLPGGESLKRLVALLRNYIGDELNWDMNLILESDKVPPLQLGAQAQLGWTTWLTPSRPFEKDAADLTLSPIGLGDSIHE